MNHSCAFWMRQGEVYANPGSTPCTAARYRRKYVLCAGRALTPAGDFCPKCGAESMSLRVKPPRPGLQFTPINHFWVVMLVACVRLRPHLSRAPSMPGWCRRTRCSCGIPLVIGVLVAYMTRPQSGLGTTIKVVTILLCVVCPLVGEGFDLHSHGSSSLLCFRGGRLLSGRRYHRKGPPQSARRAAGDPARPLRHGDADQRSAIISTIPRPTPWSMRSSSPPRRSA